NKNIWKDSLQRWHLLNAKPFGLAVRPSEALLKREISARQERAAAEVKRLEEKYTVTDDQEALQRYQADYDRESAALAAPARDAGAVKFIDNPPLTLDEQIDFREEHIGGVPLVSSTFDNMTGTTVGLALRLDGVAASD